MYLVVGALLLSFIFAPISSFLPYCIKCVSGFAGTRIVRRPLYCNCCHSACFQSCRYLSTGVLVFDRVRLNVSSCSGTWSRLLKDESADFLS